MSRINGVHLWFPQNAEDAKALEFHGIHRAHSMVRDHPALKEIRRLPDDYRDYEFSCNQCEQIKWPLIAMNNGDGCEAHYCRDCLTEASCK